MSALRREPVSTHFHTPTSNHEWNRAAAGRPCVGRPDQRDQDKAAKFAECMRENGVSDPGDYEPLSRCTLLLRLAEQLDRGEDQAVRLAL